jgi:phosphoglycolate phosphatase
MIAKMNRLITFDIDDTLLKNAEMHGRALTTAIKVITKKGTIPSIKDILVPGMTDYEIVLSYLDKLNVSLELAPEILLQASAFYSNYGKREKSILLPGVKELLSAVSKEGFFCALVTGNCERIAYEKLRNHDIVDYFVSGGFGDIKGTRKDLFPIAQRKVESLIGKKIDRKIHFGDSPADISGAQAHGFISVGLLTGSSRKEDLQEAAYILDDLSQIDTIMKFIKEA